MFAYQIYENAKNGLTYEYNKKLKFSDIPVQEVAQKSFPNNTVTIDSKVKSNTTLYAYQLVPIKIELIIPSLFDAMHKEYCAETLNASCATEERTIDHKLYNAAEQRYYARIKNLWTKKGKYLVKLLNLYLYDENCFWIYYKENIYSVNLNNPQIYYVHTVQTIAQKAVHAWVWECNLAKAIDLIVKATGCDADSALVFLRAIVNKP